MGTDRFPCAPIDVVWPCLLNAVLLCPGLNPPCRYSAVGKLAKRLPELFHNNIELAERFFAVAGAATPDLRWVRAMDVGYQRERRL